MKRIIIIATLGCFMTSAIIADTGPPVYAQTNVKELALQEIAALEASMIKDHYSLEKFLQEELTFKIAGEQEAEKATLIAPIAIVPQSELFLKVVTNGYVTKIPYNICERDDRPYKNRNIALKNNYPASGGISFRS